MQLRLAALAVALFAGTPLPADPIVVGSGASSAFVTFDFTLVGGSFYDYEVFFDGTPTGEDLLFILFTDPAVSGTIVTADSPASPSIPGSGNALGLKYFAFDGDGVFDDSFVHSVRLDADTGIQDDVDFDPTWAYWTREDVGAPFTESFIGMDDRLITDGDHDAFVFGSFGGPPTFPAPGPPTTAVPEPSSLVLAGVIAASAQRILARRRGDTATRESRTGSG